MRGRDLSRGPETPESLFALDSCDFTLSKGLNPISFVKTSCFGLSSQLFCQLGFLVGRSDHSPM